MRTAQESVVVQPFYVSEHEFRHFGRLTEQFYAIVGICVFEQFSCASKPDAVLLMVETVEGLFFVGVWDFDFSEAVFIASASDQVSVCEYPEASFHVHAYPENLASGKKRIFILMQTISVESIKTVR